MVGELKWPEWWDGRSAGTAVELPSQHPTQFPNTMVPAVYIARLCLAGPTKDRPFAGPSNSLSRERSNVKKPARLFTTLGYHPV